MFCVFFLFADNRLRSRSPKKENNYHSTRSFSVSSCSPSLSALSFCTLFLSCSLSFPNHTRLLLLLLSQAAPCDVICLHQSKWRHGAKPGPHSQQRESAFDVFFYRTNKQWRCARGLTMDFCLFVIFKSVGVNTLTKCVMKR